jgi:hypothetical protein
VESDCDPANFDPGAKYNADYNNDKYAKYNKHNDNHYII